MENTMEDKIIIGQEYKSENLNQLWLSAKNAGSRKDNIFKVITAVDAGEQWAISKDKIRKSQSLPVSNVLSTSRDTRQGALSVTGFVGEFESKSELMDQFAPFLTEAFSAIWREGHYDKATDSALENMLTYGTGITMVTTNGTAFTGEQSEYLRFDDIELVNIEPSSLYPDPAATNEREANYYFIKQSATINYLRSIPRFKQAIEENYSAIAGKIKTLDSGTDKLHSDFAKDYSADTIESDFIIYVGKAILDGGQTRWDMIYMFGDIIIDKIIGIQPNKCPLVFARERFDKKSFWGQSSFKSNLALQLSINELDSAFLTHAKKQQDPIAIIAAGSGINPADFTQNRDLKGRAFLSSGRSAADAVHYLQLPDLPSDATQASEMLIQRVQNLMGTDAMYSGQGAGSLQTSGGISQVLQRAGLRDVKVVKNFQTYLRDLYLLLCDHIKMRKGIIRYSSQDHAEGDVQYRTIDLRMVKWDDIVLIVDISNHTGSAQEANQTIISTLFQQSVQYAASQPLTEPAIMTADEYLQGIKEPNLHKLIAQIQERRKRERELDMSQQVAHIIQVYLQLVSNGTTPQEAIIMVAQEYAGDPGILKGFKVADMQQQQAAAQQQAQGGGMQGTNTGGA